MLSLFAPRLPIDRDELEFQLATLKWLTAQHGSPSAQPLVLPTDDFFPLSGKRGDEGVRELFGLVRAAAGVAEWPCELRRGTRNRPVTAGNSHLLLHEGPSAPCGTFQIVDGPTGQTAVITYNPDMEGDRGGLVATFAHELGHYLMAASVGTPPGGWDLHELHTDIAGVYLGFGIFLANGARSFRQFQDAVESGWSASAQGYLSEGALVTATAIVERLAGRDPMAAAPYLKDYLATDLRRAVRGLARLAPDMEAAVAAVDLEEYA